MGSRGSDFFSFLDFCQQRHTLECDVDLLVSTRYWNAKPLQESSRLVWKTSLNAAAFLVTEAPKSSGAVLPQCRGALPLSKGSSRFEESPAKENEPWASIYVYCIGSVQFTHDVGQFQKEKEQLLIIETTFSK